VPRDASSLFSSAGYHEMRREAGGGRDEESRLIENWHD